MPQDILSALIPLLPVALAALAAAPPPQAALRPSDLWSTLGDVPGVVLDRVNVGGSESALQPVVLWRGDAGGTTWTLDGIDVTDPAAPGNAAVYLHPALVGELGIASPLDVRVRSAGVPVEVQTASSRPRRLRLFTQVAPSALQSGNRPAELRDTTLVRGETGRWVDAGLRLDQPVGSALETTAAATWSELTQRAFTEHDETHRLTSMLARAAVRLGAGRAALSFVRAEKVHEDRDTTFSTEPEARWRQSGPNHVVALNVEHPLGSGATLRLRAGHLDEAFRLDPQGGRAASPLEDFRGISRGSYLSVESKRRRWQADVEAQARRAIGSSRLVLAAGAGYRQMPVSTRSGWPGNKVIAAEREQVFFRTFRLTGFATPTRDQDVRSTHQSWGGYATATLERDGLTVTAGFRMDVVSGHNESGAIGANPTFPQLLPALTFDGAPARFRWVDPLPRVGVRWRATADDRLRLGAQYAAYAGPLGSADVTYDNAGQAASVSYYWRDGNANHAVDADELDLVRGRLGASGVDPDDPRRPFAPNRIDPDLRSPRTHEWSLTADTRAAAAEARLVAYYRRKERVLWRPLQNLTSADYAIRGAVSGRLFDRGYSVGYYAPASLSKLAPGFGRVLTNRDGYHEDVFGVEMQLTGRVGPAAWSAWGAACDWRERFDDPALAVQDPTSLDGNPQRDRGMAAARAGGLGRDVFMNARWTGGASIRGPLAAGLVGTALLHARDGFPVPYFQTANSGDPSAGAKNVLVAPQIDTYRLPALAVLDLRLERAFRLRGGQLTLAADAFNALNRATTLQVERDVELSAYGRPSDVLRPRIVRLGVSYDF
jgi:hypothetical protein